LLFKFCQSRIIVSAAEALQKPFIMVDAGMQLPQTTASPWCYHITYREFMPAGLQAIWPEQATGKY